MFIKVAALACGLMLASIATSADQPALSLHVTGQFAKAPVTLDRAALDDLSAVTIKTSTVITDGTHSFTGFLMRDLLDHLGATGTSVTAVALNDYSVEIPMNDFYDYDVIVATHMDGKALRRADKGPFWIVYPRDDHRALQDIRFDYRWVWQLYQLDVQ
ncbi:molybdopterin-dependent oxidoreductase [Primorskyibacter flagellatus]|uniref:molybdopterin-dependent oxidoreductase n=1 Tax=Primorskyibacter flagellatus TaxID=1387277 RepID=UPI003A9564C0